MTQAPTYQELAEKNDHLESLVRHLQEQLEWLKKQVFGSKSERLIDNTNQLEFPGLDLPKKELSQQTVKEHTRKKREPTGENTLTYPEDLPVEKIVLDLPEKQKICPHTQEPLKHIGNTITRKLAFKPGNYFIKEYIRPKYISNNHPELGVQTAQLPEGIFLKSKADESLLGQIVTMKFADHLPLYRIQEILKRDHIHLSRELLSSWVLRIGENLSLLYDIMKQLLQGNTLFVDETPVQLLVKGKGKTHQAYMWVYCGGSGSDPPYRLFQFCLTRQHHHPIEQLQNYQGVLHSDSYGAYQTLAQKKEVTWVLCMAHIRRYFYEARSGDQKFRDYVLRKIRYLYMFEKVAKKRSSEERIKIRLEKEKPILDELIEKVKEKIIKGKHLPKSNYRKALEYFCRLSPYLQNYLHHPEAHVDNNTAEQVIRPLAIGRKNWLFVGSEDGGKATATLLSLVQTCRNLSVNPRDYLDDILRRIMDHPVSRLEELLPDEWAKRKNSL